MEPKKLEHRQTEQTQAQQHLTQQPVLEFNTPEELLRYDAAQVNPPTRLARRLSESIARECKTARSWWRRLWRWGRED
jgi:hypothetical protein